MQQLITAWITLAADCDQVEGQTAAGDETNRETFIEHVPALHNWSRHLWSWIASLTKNAIQRTSKPALSLDWC